MRRRWLHGLNSDLSLGRIQGKSHPCGRRGGSCALLHPMNHLTGIDGEGIECLGFTIGGCHERGLLPIVTPEVGTYIQNRLSPSCQNTHGEETCSESESPLRLLSVLGLMIGFEPYSVHPDSWESEYASRTSPVWYPA